MEQMCFGFLTPSSASPGPPASHTEPPAVVRLRGLRMSGREWLEYLVSDGCDLSGGPQPLIFLYGRNPHLVFVRVHSRDEPDYVPCPVERAHAERVLAENGYYHHSNHISHYNALPGGHPEGCSFGESSKHKKFAQVWRLDIRERKRLLKKRKGGHS